MIDDRAIQFFLPGGRRSAIALNGRTGGCCGVCAAFDGFLAALLGLFTDKYQPPNVFTVPDRGAVGQALRLDQPNDRKVLPGELGYMVSNCRTKCMEEKNKYIPILGTTFPKFPVKGKDLPFGRSLVYFNLLRKLLI